MLEDERLGSSLDCLELSVSKNEESVWKTCGQAAELSLMEMFGGCGGFDIILSELVEAARLLRVAVVWLAMDEVDPRDVSRC
jgi:hypothetical protein